MSDEKLLSKMIIIMWNVQVLYVNIFFDYHNRICSPNSNFTCITCITADFNLYSIMNIIRKKHYPLLNIIMQFNRARLYLLENFSSSKNEVIFCWERFILNLKWDFSTWIRINQTPKRILIPSSSVRKQKGKWLLEAMH